jgi:PTH1 family peptidyl-tRNA hydrolase
MKLIVGLGNPGHNYERTRHNAGFLAVDALADKEGAPWKTDRKRHADIASFRHGEEKILLAKPLTFMNLSGDAVSAIASFYGIEIGDILIVHDDMDIETGRMKFVAQGSPAGHNGIKDIQQKLGSKAIARLRLGIGKPTKPIATEDWVLSRLSPKELPKPLDMVAGMRDWIEGGIPKASNAWNKKDKKTSA